MDPIPKPTTICLNMIVKNESHIIIDTLKNLCSYIDFSYWVISDTGSTDNTKELIIEFFNERGIVGELVEHEWTDFAYNRTKALECAFNKTDFLFVFDADDSIIGDFKLPDVYDCDRYTLNFGTDFSYVRPLLFTNRKKWCFKGVLHEYLENIDSISKSKNIEGNYHVNSGRSGSRNKNPNKYIDDAIILKNAHFKVLDTEYSLACRYAFYCAQSYKDAGLKYMDDAIEWYKKCLNLNMWIQEKYHSCLIIGDLYMKKTDTINALKYWYKTIEYDRERLEGIINAQNYLRCDGQHMLVNALYHKFKNYKRILSNKLFLFQSVYNDQLEYNNMISSYYVNDKESGYECFKTIISNCKIENSLLKSTITNFKYYIDLFKLDTYDNALNLFYAFDNVLYNISKTNAMIDATMITIWNTMFDKVRPLLTAEISNKDINKDIINKDSNKVEIMITFTTCKRLDLFKQTVNSILNHWTDINKIDYWFCVDDNSCENDKKEMTKIYPWINYYMKSNDEKGHRQSMNIIWNKLNELKPVYWIHMEDDFLFHYKTNYIEQAIDGLKYNDVKQILFNRNYGEIIDSYNTKGHINATNATNATNIVLHNHFINNCNYINCHYWPHYSFRPSLTETKTILELGNFDSENQFFEMDYAKKWTASGHKSGFFNRITCRHIGRLTSDRNTKIVKNAYDLNNEAQFSPVTNLEQDIIKYIKFSENKIKIINLERRPDRKAETIQKLFDARFEPDEYEFINAVDGYTLEPTLFIKNLFAGNDFGNRKGFIGCALTHYNLWQQLANDSTNTYYVIMEDDFTLSLDFKDRLDTLNQNGELLKKELLFLGYHMFEKDRKLNFDIYNNTIETVKIVPLNTKVYIGGTFAYSINKKGATKMLDYIKTNGIKHGIDYLIKLNTGLHGYECQPQLVFSEWNENGAKIDSDIQNIYDRLDFSNISENLESHFTFIPNLDIIGDDIYYHNKTIQEQMTIAYNDNECIGFNTLGFFKNKKGVKNTSDLKPSKYFKDGDGLYIKKEYYELNKINTNTNRTNTIKIKMLCNWTSSENLCKEWSNMCEHGFGYKWKNYELVWTDVKEYIDYYVIINYPPKDAYYDPKRTIVFQMEPWINDLTKPWGVKTWGKWAEPNPTHFLAVRGRKTDHHNNAFWQLELTLNDLETPGLFEKTNCTTVSSICSSKYFDEGHIARIDFLKFLEAKDDILLDIYNQDNKHGFTNYRGPVSPYIDKSNGIKQYKYYFMMENNYESNFITEKLWEPILCETLVFYYGCPNVTNYIDNRAFVLLDVNDFEQSYQIIKQAIKEDWWSQRIDIIKKEKRRILEELAFFPVIDKIICNDR